MKYNSATLIYITVITHVTYSTDSKSIINSNYLSRYTSSKDGTSSSTSEGAIIRVNYFSKYYADHLLNTLGKQYAVLTDWEGCNYLELTIEWN